jgi:hypothetical protein
MAINKQIEELNERMSMVLSSVGDLRDEIEIRKNQVVIEPIKVSPIRKHFDTIVENALNAPHSTLSGLAVGACYVGTKFFPQYGSVLADLQETFTALTGVTAGSAVLNKTKAVAKPEVAKSEEYG